MGEALRALEQGILEYYVTKDHQFTSADVDIMLQLPDLDQANARFTTLHGQIGENVVKSGQRVDGLYRSTNTITMHCVEGKICNSKKEGICLSSVAPLPSPPLLHLTN